MTEDTNLASSAKSAVSRPTAAAAPGRAATVPRAWRRHRHQGQVRDGVTVLGAGNLLITIAFGGQANAKVNAKTLT